MSLFESMIQYQKIKNMNSITIDFLPKTKDLEFRTKFEYCNIFIEIQSINFAILDSFEALLRPHFVKVTDPKQVDYTYHLMEDNTVFHKIDEAFDELSVQNKVDSMTMTFCSNNKGTLKIDRVKEKDFVIFKSIKTPSFLIQDLSKNNHFYFIVAEGYSLNPKWNKDGFVFFEHILNKLLNINGTILLHASAVMKENRCFLFLGQKRAGKTTMFYEICKKYNYTPISVDKVHLYLSEDKKLRAFGFPGRLRTLAGTLTKYSPYFDFLIPEAYQKTESTKLWLGESASKVTIPIPEFEKFIGNSFGEKATLTHLVFPKIGKDEKLFVRELNYDEFIEKIEACTFTPHNPEEDWWSDIGKEKEEEMERTKLNIFSQIWNQCSIYEFRGSENLDIQFKELFEM